MCSDGDAPVGGSTGARFMIRRLLLASHINYKIRSLSPAGELAAVYFESAPVSTQDELDLFHIAWESGQFVKSTLGRSRFLRELVHTPRVLHLKFSASRTKESSLKKIDYDALRRWWNRQVGAFHGKHIQAWVPVPLVDEGLQPVFSAGQLAKLSGVNMDNVKLKDIACLRAHTVEVSTLVSYSFSYTYTYSYYY
jgi:hypothetical protein